MAMSQAQKNLFVKNRVHLVNTIIPNDEFISHLRQGNHISDSMEEEIMVCTQIIYLFMNLFIKLASTRTV